MTTPSCATSTPRLLLQTPDPALAAYMGAYPAENASTPPEDSSPSSRSFFSRFALPLRSRTRNLADFHIRPDEPHRLYSAGDHVRGAVILTIVKPVRITHLTVALHGYVRVYKGPAVAEPAVSPPTSSRFQYHGNGHASLFQDEQVLSGEGRLEAGKYEFNFDLVFPEKGLPSSIDVGCHYLPRVLGLRANKAILIPVRTGHYILSGHRHTHSPDVNIPDFDM
jgi:hypothetical protein